jgi:hypothetical protein
MPYGENDNHPLTNGTYGWHEDFEDCPSVEERYPVGDDDQILERQELEDFEGLGWFDGDYGGEG